MYRVAYFNHITPQALSLIDKELYEIVENDAEYDALLLRSKEISIADVSKDVLYIGRAGAGVNNIDVPAY